MDLPYLLNVSSRPGGERISLTARCHGHNAVPPSATAPALRGGGAGCTSLRLAGGASAVNAQQVDGEENQQDGAYPNASAPTITPAPVAVVRPTSTQSQQPNCHEDQHDGPSFLSDLRARPKGRKLLLAIC